MAEKLPKTKTKRTKRRGRGYGSGRGGHTAGRGTKGQKARSKIGVLFEGIKMKKSFIKRLPLRRGKGKFKAKDKPLIVKLKYLEAIPAGTKIDVEALAKFGIVRKEDALANGIKILGNGDVKKKFTVLLPISHSAAKRIEKAGGKVVRENTKLEARSSKQAQKSKSKTKKK